MDLCTIIITIDKFLLIKMKQIFKYCCAFLIAMLSMPLHASDQQGFLEQENQENSLGSEYIKFASGSVTGIYYPAAGTICRIMNRSSSQTNLRCSIFSTAGSIENLNGLSDATYDIAVVQSDWQKEAYEGTGFFENKKIADLRFLYSLHDEAVTIVVRKGSTIRSLNDLRGKIVNLGAKSSGTYRTMERVLNFKGIPLSSLQGITTFNSVDQAKALCSGDIDAMVMISGHPNGAIVMASNECEVKIVDVVDDDVQRFLGQNREFSLSTIPGGMYNGIVNDVSTFGLKATVVATSHMSDAVAYYFTQAVFDNFDGFKTLHPVFGTLDKQEMASEGRIAPLHPGAETYYRDNDINY